MSVGGPNGTNNFNIAPLAPYLVYDRACAWALPVNHVVPNIYYSKLTILQAGCNQPTPVYSTPAPVVVPTVVTAKTTAAPKPSLVTTCFGLNLCYTYTTTPAPAPPPPTSTARPFTNTITTIVYVTQVVPSRPGGIGEREEEIAVEEKALVARDSAVVPPPWILSLIGTVTLSQICTCILGGSSGPPTTVYGPSYQYTYVYLDIPANDGTKC